MSISLASSLASWAKPKAWFTVAAVLVLTLAFVAAGSAQTKPTDRLSELAEISGASKSFDHMAAVLKPVLKQSLADMKGAKGSPDSGYWEKVIAGLDPAIDAAFAAEAMRREYLRAMDGKLDVDEIDTVIAFMKSPLGARMVALEVAGVEADPDAAENKAAELMEELKSDPDRAEVLKLVERAIRLKEVWTDYAFNLGRALAIGLAAVNADMMLQPDDIEIINQAVEEQRPAIAAEIEKSATAQLAYTYHDASVSELREYLAFLQSSAGQKFYAAEVAAVNQVLAKAGTDFGWALMRELGKERR
jgi:hypothetical protein